ncbi:MAG TPA: T9SS type A sorting domain-containing protein [Bacteroidia bacterium]|nr:T9SS type A sorting domain-containing protein [Bacteroidia bacterium]
MKPFIVVPGIDPPTIKAFNFGKEGETFETFLANEFGTGMINLASDLNSFLLSEGYDLIYINYRDGGDFIQRNAQLVKSVIREVNNQKLLNGSTEPTTIMGISMGGLVARWALLEMEDASEQHDVENFISYDVPYNGANVPIAFQAMLNHVYDMNIWVGSYALGIPIFIPLPIRLFVPEIGDAEKILGCNAALQLLKHHTYSNTLYPMVPTSTSFRNTMMSFLDSKGFPSQVSSRGKQIKNVALLNGADNVTDQGIGNSSTFLAIDIERKLIIPPLFNIMPHVSLLGFKTDVETWSMPIAIQGKKRIYRGLYTGILSLGGWFTTFIIAGQKDEIEDGIGIDNVPGSFQSIKANTGGVALGGATLEQLGISIHTDRFTFNPTISSSALVSPFRDNLEYDIDGNFDNLLQNWTNNESQINNYEIPKNSSNVTINTSHTAWYPRASTFIQNLHVPAYSGTVGVILSNSPISSGEVYNYGQGTTNRLPFSSGLYTININGGSVKINSDEKVGYTPDLNNNNSSPPAGSTFKVFSSISDGCGGVTSIGISNGGQLIVGDNSVNNMGELYMKEGSSIDILDDGILIIHNNSKVVIEEGATLTYHPGAQILLDGENAVLEIRGTLKIMDGANFTFGKSSGVLKAGFIRFDLSHFTSGGIEVTGTTAEINLPGNNDPLLGSDKVLEIIGGELTTPDGSVTSPELAAFNISNGWVQYSSGGALGISVPGNFSETYFIGSGSAGSEKGLIVYMPSIVSISECRFNQLERGVVLYMDNGFTGTYTIDNSTFDVNERGIEAIEGSLEIVNCDFKYNTEYGVYAPSLEGDCEFNDCYFLDNGVGINMHSNASSPVNCYVFHSGFENNDVGISTTSSQKVNLTLECNKFKNNDEGIAAGGELNLSPNLTLGGHSGGDNVFYDDSVASISTYYSLYLQNGNNSFINSSGVSTTLIATYGNGLITCSSYPCLFYQSSTVIAGANNFWSGSFVNILFDASSNSLTIGGPNNSSFTSSCFYIPSGTEPQFVSTGLPPFSKHDYTMDVQPEVKGPELRVFPNPATNNLFIQTPAKGDNTYTVSIFDIAGKKLLSETFSVSNYAVLAMPVDALSSGTYFIKITTLDGTVNENRKIVILK